MPFGGTPPRFSGRTPRSLAPNRVTRRLDEKRRSGERILDLTQSNPTRAGFVYPADRILGALSNPDALRYDPSPRGLPAAREAIAAYHGLASADPILLTSSTSESYSWLFKLLCDPGDEILVPRPSYPLFECLAELESVKVVSYPLDPDHRWAIDFHSLESLATAKSRAIVLVHPNNPTGSFVARDELSHLADFCRRNSLAVIADEVFAATALTDDPNRLPTLSGAADVLTFVLSGLSKPAGLPQMKLGWIMVSGDAGPRNAALERLEWIADAYLAVSAPVQHACAAWLALVPELSAQILRRVRDNRALLAKRLTEIPSVRLLPAEGGWSAIVEVPKVCSEEDWVLRLLDEHNILVQPGFFYEFDREAFLVLSLLPAPHEFEEGIGKMRKTLVARLG
jgi:alanine-synthesizing transaminase